MISSSGIGPGRLSLSRAQRPRRNKQSGRFLSSESRSTLSSRAGGHPLTDLKGSAETTGSRGRRTQAERSSETRRALCEAALDVLAEDGFDKATTAKIVARAGLSRGAQVHHFATKSDLIVAAFEHLLREWNVARRELIEGSRSQPVSISAYLDFQWQRIFRHPRYVAALELMLAARANDALAMRLRDVLERWSGLRDEIWQQLFRARRPDTDLEALLHLTRCVLRGMAVHASFNESDELDRRVLDLWSRIAGELLEPRADGRASEPCRDAAGS